MNLNLGELRAANVSRKDRWHEDDDRWTGADWSNAMCGEAGEAANVVKKLRRDELGLTPMYRHERAPDLLLKLANEIADTVIYADLLAEHYGIDLSEAIVKKFNEVSERSSFPERLLDPREGDR